MLLWLRAEVSELIDGFRQASHTITVQGRVPLASFLLAKGEAEEETGEQCRSEHIVLSKGDLWV